MSVLVKRNVVYGETEKEYLTADVYQPSNYNEALPILVLIHGGAFQAGSKEMYESWGEKLAESNYFVVAINYQLASLHYGTYPNVLIDLNKALNWLVSKSNEWHLDLGRIGLVGDSAGAYLASMTAFNSHSFSYRIRSVVGVYGVYDLVEECLNPVIRREVNMFERLLGMSFEGNESAFKNASPINYIEDAVANPIFDTRFFLTWGEKDRIVNPNQSKLFYQALKEANIHVEMEKFNDLGHFWFNELPGVDGGKATDYPNNLLYPKMMRFLDETVRHADTGHFSKRLINDLLQMDHQPNKK